MNGLWCEWSSAQSTSVWNLTEGRGGGESLKVSGQSGESFHCAFPRAEGQERGPADLTALKAQRRAPAQTEQDAVAEAGPRVPGEGPGAREAGDGQ